METTVTTWNCEDFEAVVTRLAVRDGNVLVTIIPGRVSHENVAHVSERVRGGLEQAGLSKVAVLVAEQGMRFRRVSVRTGDTLLVSYPGVLSLVAQLTLQEHISGTLADQGLPGIRVVVVDRDALGQAKSKPDSLWQKIKHALAI